MKNLNRVLLALGGFAIIAAGAPAYAATGNASADVAQAIAIAEQGASPLGFGSFTPTGVAGHVMIAATAAGTRTSDANVTLIPSDAGKSGKFDVTGSGALHYTVTLAPTVTLTDGDVEHDMTATLVSSPTGAGGVLVGGAQTLYVGGDLTVGANQVANHYAGTYDISVAYN